MQVVQGETVNAAEAWYCRSNENILCLQDLLEAGGELPDAVVERLWNIIQALDPSRQAGSSAAGAEEYRPHPKPRPGAAIPGLALQNTREYAKHLDEELINEAQDKIKQITAADDASREQQKSGRDREGRKADDGDRVRDRSREGRRDADADRYGSRDRSRSRERRRR